jgi:hypothetical protein
MTHDDTILMGLQEFCFEYLSERFQFVIEIKIVRCVGLTDDLHGMVRIEWLGLLAYRLSGKTTSLLPDCC